MGLISALTGSVSGVFADQWREYFYCESIDKDTIVVKGEKRVGNRSSNKKGSDNLISNGSIIAVAEGQCAMIVEQGKVVDVVATSGEYVYDTSTEPSLLYGNLGRNILDTFKNIGKRFTFGGEPPKDQRVYYINTKELLGNKYGTPGSVPFRVVDERANIDIDVNIKCFGEYSYHVCDPILFYTNICSNVSSEYKRDELDSQLKSELLTALQPAFARISAQGVRYSQLPAYTTQMADAMNAELSAKWREYRGIEIVNFGISSVKADEEDEAMLKQLQRDVTLSDPSRAAAHLVAGQVDAMKDAANNTAGAMTGFMGMGMAGQMGGMGAAASNLFAMGGANPYANQPVQAAPLSQPSTNPDSWQCACGNIATGKFCTECGAKKPNIGLAGAWKCNCGTENTGKFCYSCGSKKPEGAPIYKCDKCGWIPANPSQPPKFCPECGDPFDANDIV